MGSGGSSQVDQVETTWNGIMPTTQEHTQSIDSDPEAHSVLFKEIMESIEVVFSHFLQLDGFRAERLGDAMRVLGMSPTEDQVRKHLEDLGGPQYIDERTFHYFIKDELIKHLEKVQVVVDHLKQYDKDGKGALSRDELQAAIRGHEGQELQELQASVAKVPGNSQGHLGIVELAKCFLELSDSQAEKAGAEKFQRSEDTQAAEESVSGPAYSTLFKEISASTDAVFKYFSKPSGVPAARLGHAMAVLGMNLTEDEVEKRLTDLGRPEYIDQNMFHNLIEEELRKPMPKVQELLDYLKQFDKDGKGALSKEEVQELMRGSELSHEKVQASLRKMPRNSEGHLDIAKLSKYFLELGDPQVGTEETARRDMASGVRQAIVQIAEAEAQYDLKDAKAFAQFLQDADVRLVRARYLTELVRSRRPLPRRQELQSMTFVPPDSEEAETALVSHQEVQTWAEGHRDAIICSISHAWETREHPDPCRYQLEQVAQHVALYEAAFKADVWVFYDYASLFLELSSPEEQNSFGAAMQNMHVMYAHEHTLTLRIESLTPDDVWNRMMDHGTQLVPVYDKDEKCVVAKPLKDLVANKAAYLSRGWCMAEVEWSSLRTVNLQHQRIGGVDDRSDDGSHLNGRIPTTPENFRSKMAEAVFTHRSDAESVIRLQEKIFFQKVTACEHLELEGLPADQMVALAHALPLYRNLKSLKLKTFRCSEGEVEALAKAFATSRLQSLTVGNDDAESSKLMVKALAEGLKMNKSITNIDLQDNHIGTEGAKALAEVLKINKSITTINLGQNQIGADSAKALAEALKINRSITNINLGFNDIGTEGAKALAEALKSNKSITTIDLEYNQIGAEGAKALAEVLKSNKSITTIDFEYNQIWAEGAKALVEALKKHSSISTIDLSRNEIGDEGAKALAEALKKNSSISTIDLSRNEIGDEGAKAFAEVLKIDKSITTIDLGGNKIGAEGAKALAEVLKSNKSITTIDLGWNNIRAEGAKALAEALKKNSSISTIDLSRNEIGAEGAKALAEALKINKSVTNMELEGNEIGADSAKALAEALKKNACITNMDLEGNEIGADSAKEESDRQARRTPFETPVRLQALAQALQINASVTTIDLGWNNIDAEGAKALAEALRINASITDIDLRDNQIGAEGAKALAEALVINASVTTIDLGRNQIGAEGAKALAEALKINVSVTKIDLRGNQIGAEGAEALAGALKNNVSITFIDFEHNEIGDEGAKALAEALKNNASVTTINLFNNEIGAEGAKALAEALKIKQSIRTINVGKNDMGDEGAKALAEALKNTASITHFLLWGNQVGAEGAKALAEALKNNVSITFIDLENNEMGAEGAKALAEALKINASVTTIDLRNNLQGDEGAKALTEAVEERNRKGVPLECRH